MAGFLTDLHVRSFGCLKDVKLKLTPLHALIGPNDSGKSTLLRAIGTLGSRNVPPSTTLFAQFADRSGLDINRNGTGVRVRPANRPQILGLQEAWQDADVRGQMAARVFAPDGSGVRVELIRLDPDELRTPGNLIPEGEPLVLQGRGGNLPGLYDALRDRNNERFAEISRTLAALFPTVRTLNLRTTGASQKVLAVDLLDGTSVRADAMSEGMLYFLAFAIVGDLEKPAAYLIEEPENGLHPSRIQEVVRMLRAISEDPERPVQIVMATHSPLVINELRPDEVTVVTRDPDTGTRLTPMNETPRFAERSKVYALGELWLAYADGKSEEPLLRDEAS
jgi:ABC-type branched-subunit amino acid transport system ATPase component